MGNQTSGVPDSQNPLVRKLHYCLLLKDANGKKRTASMVHQNFIKQIMTNEVRAKINREMSPFCPLDIQDDSNWITSVFVSPIMLLASPLFLCDSDGMLDKKLKVIPCYQSETQTIAIKDVIVIQKNDVCLLVLEEPYWRVGWAGISYINSIEDLQSEELRIINHPTRVSSNLEDEEMVHVQTTRKFVVPKNSSESNPLAVQVNGITGSAICKLVNEKPYVVGIQASDYEAIFFNEKTFKKINEQTQKYMRQANRLSEAFNKIDLVQFERETKRQK